MTSTRTQDMSIDLSITIATPEDEPLAIFGLGVSDGVRQLLEENGILTLTSAHGMLLTGGKPLYISAQVTGGHGSSCQLSGTPTW